MTFADEAASGIQWITARSKTLGFDLCGVVAVEDLAAPARLEEWLARGFAGEMRYLHDPRRAAPAETFPGARSVIVCALNYNQPQPYSTEAAAHASADRQPRAWISRYAWGDDYHVVLSKKLDQLTAALHEHFGGSFTTRAYVDTGPVAERTAARLAGLGWQGKNTCLINNDLGSWLFLGVIVTSLDLVHGAAQSVPPPDLCGNCTLCLDACPTGALVEPYVMDARRCISYLTIELRGAVPEELRAGVGWHVFGCDICQDVCPWNRAAPSQEPATFRPRSHLRAPELAWLLNMTEVEFREQFRGSPVKRTKWLGLLRNACIVAGNALRKESAASETAELQALRQRLTHLAQSDQPLIAAHARWALEQQGKTR